MPPHTRKSNRLKVDDDAPHSPDTPSSSKTRGRGSRGGHGNVSKERGPSTREPFASGAAQNNDSHTNAGTTPRPPNGGYPRFARTYAVTPTKIIKDYHGFLTLKYGKRSQDDFERALQASRVNNAGVASRAGERIAAGDLHSESAGLSRTVNSSSVGSTASAGKGVLDIGDSFLRPRRNPHRTGERGTQSATASPVTAFGAGARDWNSLEAILSPRQIQTGNPGSAIRITGFDSTSRASTTRVDRVRSRLEQILSATPETDPVSTEDKSTATDLPDYRVQVPVDFNEDSLAEDSGIDVTTPAELVNHCMPTAPMAGQMNTGMNQVQSALKDVIQDLFDVQSMVHGYQTETEGPLIDKMVDLTNSLSHIRNLASTGPNAHPLSVAHTLPSVAPELIDYVDEGRNPDIYTREIVESVQRGNAILNGRQQAFGSFAQIFAQKIRDSEEAKRKARRDAGEPELDGGIDMVKEVDRILRNAGLEEDDGGDGRRDRNGIGSVSRSGIGDREQRANDEGKGENGDRMQM